MGAAQRKVTSAGSHVFEGSGLSTSIAENALKRNSWLVNALGGCGRGLAGDQPKVRVL